MGYWQERNKPYKPGQTEVFKVSRSKIELFMQCPRCFWLDVRLKIKRPSSPPFNINKAIDELFKKEFDTYRISGEPHPLMKENGIKAVPFAHKDIDTWRENFVGVVHVHEPTNLHVFGAVDDVWIDDEGKLIVVDYKATAKDKPVKALGAEGTWQDMYRRQMETYQWLLRQNGFEVSDTGYFVYATGTSNRDAFNNIVEFETHLIPHTGKSDWVDDVLVRMKKVMDSDEMPEIGTAAMGGPCDFCEYSRARTTLTLNALRQKRKK
ncbi:MAG TPA: PD-(D/E)XK nuclease family protein [Candidatus Saccharibacteria bacterium]|jgi:CRISPR/Cas system-associated exonuclease Cas4 (RecB family)|nr:PD-(D/E)XK nuclease family protein [Candidatus Saccharibacteria bacterium]HMT55533.1 PD-(D/E)XK nuclease family protein [Candidatus Saccharibacteria bacterium]